MDGQTVKMDKCLMNRARIDTTKERGFKDGRERAMRGLNGGFEDKLRGV